MRPDLIACVVVFGGWTVLRFWAGRRPLSGDGADPCLMAKGWLRGVSPATSVSPFQHCVQDPQAGTGSRSIPEYCSKPPEGNRHMVGSVFFSNPGATCGHFVGVGVLSCGICQALLAVV